MPTALDSSRSSPSACPPGKPRRLPGGFASSPSTHLSTVSHHVAAVKRNGGCGHLPPAGGLRAPARHCAASGRIRHGLRPRLLPPFGRERHPCRTTARLLLARRRRRRRLPAARRGGIRAAGRASCRLFASDWCGECLREEQTSRRPPDDADHDDDDGRRRRTAEKCGSGRLRTPPEYRRPCCGLPPPPFSADDDADDEEMGGSRRPLDSQLQSTDDTPKKPLCGGFIFSCRIPAER